MATKHLRPLGSKAKRLYVNIMFQVIGRALQAVSEVDDEVCNEARSLPTGFLFQMMVMPKGAGLLIEHVGDGRFKYHRKEAPRPIDLSIKFKHLEHAFLVLSFQEKTSVAFANDRMLIDGDISYAVRMTRILNRLEVFILPKLVAERAVKAYPHNLQLPEKLISAARIYLKVAAHFIKTARAS
jgi:hypothetical protein